MRGEIRDAVEGADSHWGLTLIVTGEIIEIKRVIRDGIREGK